MKINKKILAACIAAMGMLASAGAHAGATLINGNIALGVNDDGSLNTTDGGVVVNGGYFNDNTTGVAYKFSDGSFYDATSPGCYCEGWGVSVNNTVSGYANVTTDGGANNLTYGALTGVTATTATSTTTLTSLPGIKVTQAYQPSTNAAGVLFRDRVTITNDTGATVNDVKYVRVMDWDIPPTEFDEFVTIKGTGSTTLLEESGSNGFNTANPIGGYTDSFDPACHNLDCVYNGPEDHGAYFRFNFGSLADGESYSFDIFYGGAADQAGAFSAISAEGLELFSLGYSNAVGAPGTGSPTYVFGFKGVGGVVVDPTSPIPEPETYAMLLAGLGLLSFTARRRQGSKQA